MTVKKIAIIAGLIVVALIIGQLFPEFTQELRVFLRQVTRIL